VDSKPVATEAAPAAAEPSPSELAERARAARPSTGMRLAEVARRVARGIPGMRQLFQTDRGRALRYWLALRLDDRVHYTFTQFLRSPAQYEALLGPVLDALVGPGRTGRLRVVVIGCSIGAEPYTISSLLLRHCPDLQVTIDGYDIDPLVLERATAGWYTEREVMDSRHVTPEFIADTFERQGDGFLVRPAVAGRVRFYPMDALDPAMPERVGPADIVYAQNILMNLSRAQARRAFGNILGLLRPRSALFIDGMDLDLRFRYTSVARLSPVDFRVREIHEEARLIRGDRYPYSYSGLPPFEEGPEATRRFATVFLRGMDR
jgi:chemotaxis methyl-accepting protein methylase